MKSCVSITAFLLAAALVFVINHESTAQSQDSTVVYYFHGQFRCHSCTRIEELTAKALRAGFSKELAGGAMVWRPTNIDDQKNHRFIRDYQLKTRSVILSKQRNGKEVRWKNLPEIWSRLQDEASFTSYIQNEIREFSK
ncbi:MAG: hypothetical protein KBA61_18270 [Spirochaetes bacterium]|nr:hypothetical protein [Spirochaetota bacterium]